MSSSYNLTHLKVLEAESIHIIREVAAEFERPVMLYSIGKDSSVMVRLAQKAFATTAAYDSAIAATLESIAPPSVGKRRLNSLFISLGATGYSKPVPTWEAAALLR